MRQNLPVTGHGIELPHDVNILSIDMHSHIPTPTRTSSNDSGATGYSRA